MGVRDIENEYSRVIQELSGVRNSVTIKCTCASEMRTVAIIATEELHAQRDSHTINAVLNGEDSYWDSSCFKWVRLSLSHDVVWMYGERKCDTYITADEFIAAFDEPVQPPSEQEFSDLFQELVS